MRLTGEATPRRPLGARVAVRVSGRAHRRLYPVDTFETLFTHLLHVYLTCLTVDVRVSLCTYARITSRINMTGRDRV